MNATETIAAIRADERFAKASATLAAEHDRIVQDVITLTEIPAPPSARRSARRPTWRCCAPTAWRKWSRTRSAT